MKWTFFFLKDIKYRILGLIFTLALSACLTEETGPTTKPNLISLNSITRTQYDRSEATLNLQGAIISNNLTPLSILTYFLNDSCSGSDVGAGLAQEFTQAGIPIKVPSNVDSTIYITTNTDHSCYYLTTYQPSFSAPGPAVFTAANPPSPTVLSTTPALFGTPSVNASRLIFFSDSQCMTQIGSGSSQDFLNIGIQVTIQPNQSNSIYSKSVEPFGNTSDCSFFADYVHRISGAGLPSFVSITPTSPNNQSTTPQLLGSVGSAAVQVSVFSDPGCKQILTSGTGDDFTKTGFQLSVPTNSTTPIYAIAYDSSNVPSLCTYMSTYTHTTVAPTGPTFGTITPPSPTNQTLYPKITGSTVSPISSSGMSVRFFSESKCVNQIGSGSLSQFISSGIVISILKNATTPVHAQLVNAAGNPSTCTLLTQYKHNIIPPDPPVFITTDPPSPNNITAQPKIIGAASTDTVSVQLYADEACKNLINMNSQTTANFIGSGIQVNLPVNTVSLLYGTSTDEEGNVSACTSLGSYAYSNLPAPDPSFTQANPASPNRFSTRPMIIGTAPTTITSVSLYQDSLCTVFYAKGSRSNFIGSGIPTSITANAFNSIYGKSKDVYGNESNCVFFTTYTHTNIAPSDPTFTLVTPATPNNTSFTPTLQGTVPINPAAILPPTSIAFYNDSLCQGPPLGQGIPSSYAGSGITIEVPPNTYVPIYGVIFDQPGNASNCTPLLTSNSGYAYDTLKPGAPLYQILTPPSTHTYSQNMKMQGILAKSKDFLPTIRVELFSDSACTQLLATDTGAAWLNTGISFIVNRNTVTSIYAKSTNQVGNQSACTFLETITHNDLGPTVNSFSARVSLNGTVNFSWTPDFTAFPSPVYTVKRSIKSGGPYTAIHFTTSTFISDISVNNNTTYYYVVDASNITGRSLNSIEKPVQVALTQSLPPANVSAQPGISRAYLNWNYSPTAMTYLIFRGTQPGGPYNTLIASELTDISYIDTTAQNNLNYYYVIVGSNPYGRSAFSNEASVIPRDAPNPGPQNLNVQTALQNPNCGNGNGLLLTWDPTTYGTTYNISRGSSSALQTALSTSNNPFYFDCGPLGGDNYYSVTTSWDIGQSSASNVAHAYFGADFTPGISTGDGFLNLSWNSLGSGGTYSIGRSTSFNGSFNLLSSGINLTSLTFTDSTVSNGTMFFYKIFPNFPSTENRASQVVGATPRGPASPPTHLAVAVNNNAPILSWTAPPFFSSFKFYRSSSSSGPFTACTSCSSITITSATDSSPPLGNNFYQVTSVWGGVESSATNSASFYKQAPAPSINSVTSVSGGIQLSWSAVSPTPSSYTLSRSTTTGGPYSDVAYPPTTTPLSYTDSAPTGHGFYYVMHANYPDGTQSLTSSEVSGLSGTGTITQPQGVSILDQGNNYATLSWLPVPMVSPTYQLFQKDPTDGQYYLYHPGNSTDTVNPPFTVGGLSPLTNNSFIVSLSNPASTPNESSYTAVTSFTATGPSSISAIPGVSQISLSWSYSGGTTPVNGVSPTFTLLRSTDSVHFSDYVGSISISSRSYTDTGVQNGTQYFYKIRVNFANGVSLSSTSSLGITPGMAPPIPSGLRVTSNNNGSSISLLWDSVFGAGYGTSINTISYNGSQEQLGSYNVYQSTTPSIPGGSSPIISTLNTSVGIGGLTAETPYYFSVSGLIGTVESALFNPPIVLIPLATPAAPVAIADLNAAARVTLTWNTITSATTYRIERSSNGSSFQVLTTVSGALGSTQTYIDNNSITLKVPYWYRFMPISSGGIPMVYSAISQPVSTGIRPIEPQNVVANGVGSSVSLSWIRSPNVVSSSLYRGTSPTGPFSLITSIADPITQVSDTVPSPGTYYYVITTVNTNGIQSINSNMISINLLTAPVGLTATTGTGAINLSWTALAGANSYTLRRGNVSGGPYGLVGSGITGTSYSDTNIENGTTYYYVVNAVTSGVSSANSAEAIANGSIRMNLEVPIEMTDRSLSSDITHITFERTRTRLDSNAYDGTVTYTLEVVASNTDTAAATISLLSAAGSTLGSISVPASTPLPTRLTTTFTPSSGQDEYRLDLSATQSADQLQVLSARIRVKQVQAGKSKLYIPLIASHAPPSHEDMNAPTGSTNSLSYILMDTGSVYQKLMNVYSQLPDYNALELDTLIATQGGAMGSAVLYNTSKNNPVLDTEAVTSAPSLNAVASPFDIGAPYFETQNEGDSYQIALRCWSGCTNGFVSIYKAGLWIYVLKLKQAEVAYRNSLGVSSVSGPTDLSEERTFIDLSAFTNPLASFESVVMTPTAGSVSMQLMSSSSNSGTTGLTGVTGSSLSFATPAPSPSPSPRPGFVSPSPTPSIGTPKLRARSSSFSLTSLQQFLTEITGIGGNAHLVDSKIIIDTSRP